jgi:hypothetical protein
MVTVPGTVLELRASRNFPKKREKDKSNFISYVVASCLSRLSPIPLTIEGLIPSVISRLLAHLVFE